jgi:DNA (cytosine-5)-methyltransferase 1
MSTPAKLRVASLFAGVGGLDLGARRAGAETVFLVENWSSALNVLAARFPGVSIHGDIRDLAVLPQVDLVTAGFPCTDLSQAGRTVGIRGEASGLIFKALELIAAAKPDHILIENVPNMIHLAKGSAIAAITDRLSAAGYAWAYRVIDSRSFGVPQRRRRVYLVASRTVDPVGVLLSDDRPARRTERSDAYGFYWTEGNRGIGWAVDALPTLKGSSTANVPSPPAVWRPDARLGQRIVRPSIAAAETAQGLPAGWTRAAPDRTRWRLVGNAVTPAVARWIVGKILKPMCMSLADAIDSAPLKSGDPWPKAAFSRDGKVWRVETGEYPVSRPLRSLADLLDVHGCEPLSLRATAGFLARLERSSLHARPAFIADLRSHVQVLRAKGA